MSEPRIGGRGQCRQCGARLTVPEQIGHHCMPAPEHDAGTAEPLPAGDVRARLHAIQARWDRGQLVDPWTVRQAQEDIAFVLEVVTDLWNARDAAEQAAFHRAMDGELAAVCLPCFEGVCEPCIETTSTAGDGQPCRCSHAGHYAAGVRWWQERADAATQWAAALEGALGDVVTAATPYRLAWEALAEAERERGEPASAYRWLAAIDAAGALLAPAPAAGTE